jgi:hypothetical protein
VRKLTGVRCTESLRMSSVPGKCATLSKVDVLDLIRVQPALLDRELATPLSAKFTMRPWSMTAI